MNFLRSLARLALVSAVAGCASTGGLSNSNAVPNGDYDVVIENGRIVDGTGAAWYYGDVALRGDRIAGIGPRGAFRSAKSRDRVDAAGLVVSPGFIDIQSGSQGHFMMGDGKAISMVTQGITTAITGEGSTLGPTNDKILAAQRDTNVRRILSKFSGPHGFSDWLE